MTFTKEQLIAEAMSRIEFLEMMLTGEPESLKERALAIELQLARMALAGMEAEPVACPKCNDTGMADSGGVQPWGDGILVPCDCSLPDPELTLLIHDLNIDGNHRLANVIQDLIEVKKAAPQPLTTTSERAELENYRNAQQVVPDVTELEAVLEWILKIPVPTFAAVPNAKRIQNAISACRTAMLQGGKS